MAARVRTIQAAGLGDTTQAQVIPTDYDRLIAKLCAAGDSWRFRDAFIQGSGSNTAFKAIGSINGTILKPRFAGGAAPSTISAAVNGLDAIRFVSNAAIGAPSGSAQISASAYTVGIVFRKLTADTTNGQVWGGQLAAGTGLAMRIRGASSFGDVDIYHNGGVELSDPVGSTGITADTWHLLVQSFDAAGTSLKLRIDGAEVAADASAAQVITGGAGLDLSVGSVGSTSQAAAFLSDMAAFDIMQIPLGAASRAADLAAYEAGIAAEFGISI